MITTDGPVKVHAGEYSTDLVHEKAVNYLEDALQEDLPFYLTVAPIACHSCTQPHDYQILQAYKKFRDRP